MSDSSSYVKFANKGFEICIANDVCTTTDNAKFIIEHEILHVMLDHMKDFEGDASMHRTKKLAMDCVINQFSSKYMKNTSKEVKGITSKYILEKYGYEPKRTDTYMDIANNIRKAKEEGNTPEPSKYTKKKDDEDDLDHQLEPQPSGEPEGSDGSGDGDLEKGSPSGGGGDLEKDIDDDDNLDITGADGHGGGAVEINNTGSMQDAVDSIRKELADHLASNPHKYKDSKDPLLKGISNNLGAFTMEKLDKEYQKFLSVLKAKTKLGKKDSWKRPSRRSGEGFKGKVKDRTKHKMLIVVDSSGSIIREVEKHITRFLNTFSGSEYEIDVCIGDTSERYYQDNFTTQELERIISEGVKLGGGGNAMYFTGKRVNAKTYDNVIFFTDLYFGSEEVKDWRIKTDDIVIVSPCGVYNTTAREVGYKNIFIFNDKKNR